MVLTKDNLNKIDILSDTHFGCSRKCGMAENVSHLFFFSLIYSAVWRKFFLGWIFHTMLNSSLAHLDQFTWLLCRGRVGIYFLLSKFVCIWIRKMAFRITHFLDKMYNHVALFIYHIYAYPAKKIKLSERATTWLTTS